MPSIFGTGTSFVDVTQITTGFFTFSSVDLADAGVGGDTYTVEGFLQGALLFSTSGTLPAGFTTIASPNPGQTIDDLRITEHQVDASYNIDNIVVTPAAVPEPSSLALLGLGTLTLLGYDWRRRKQPA